MTETTSRTPRNTGGVIAKAAAGKAAAKSERATMQSYVNRMLPEIAKALPAHIGAERFTRNILSLISGNPALAKCTPESFLSAMMTSAQLGLEVGPLGEFYILPFDNKKERRTDAVPVIGYKGLLSLAYRGGSVESVSAHAVRENDDFSYCLGLHPDLTHVPAKRERGAIIGAYAVINLKGGGYLFEYMTADEMDEHRRKYSKAGGGGPWDTAKEEMYKKTVLRKALKYCPMSTEIMRQIAADEVIKTEIAPDMSEIGGAYVVAEDTGEVIAEAPQEPAAPADGVQVEINE